MSSILNNLESHEDVTRAISNGTHGPQSETISPTDFFDDIQQSLGEIQTMLETLGQSVERQHDEYETNHRFWGKTNMEDEAKIMRKFIDVLNTTEGIEKVLKSRHEV